MPLYKNPASPYWWASLSRPGFNRIRRSTGTADRREAQVIHDEWKVELNRLKAAPTGHTWGKAVTFWCSAEERSMSELLSLRKLSKHFEDRPLTEVTAESIEEALAFCKTAGTYTRYRTMIMAILNLAKGREWIAKVPNVGTKRDKKTKRRDWITREQWAKLHAELPPHMAAMALFAITTGLRQSNVLSLTWDRVDAVRRVVWVEAEDMKGDQALAVPLNETALAVLEARRGESATHVFTFRGKPIKEVKTAFMAACVRADLGTLKRWVDDAGKPHQTYEGFTWHGLRHTWATWHAQSGTPLDVLQKLGGWADLRMLMNYVHHTPGHLAGYASATSL